MNAGAAGARPAAAQTFIELRLRNQRLAGAPQRSAADVVAWFGAVQAQDYPGAKWALSLRMSGATDAGIERAFDAGRILRTHVMRPTWHFVTPADIRWMLALTAPRVKAASASYSRNHGLDAVVLARSHDAIAKALEGGRQLTRPELSTALLRAGIAATGVRLALLLMHAELDAVVCSGARRDRQFTYALLEERVPRGRMLSRNEALAELTARYFASHGPASAQDYAWWSGLSAPDTRAGIAMLGRRMSQRTIDGRTNWLIPNGRRGRPDSPAVHLLPNYDEYFIAYKHRAALLPPAHVREAVLRTGGELAHQLAIDGRLAGSWQRTLRKKTVHIDARPFRALRPAEARALAAAAERHARFLNMPVTLRVLPHLP